MTDHDSLHAEVIGSATTGPYRAACDLLLHTGLLGRVNWPLDANGARVVNAETLTATMGSWSHGEQAIALIAAALLAPTEIDLGWELERFPGEHLKALFDALITATGRLSSR